ncbi:MAG: TerC family protein [Planctomycetota bacterium]|nr:TerC family protein [Planctomycetota bacterium]
MAEILTLENVVALLTLSAMEIVLGIDNIVFIAILTSRLPAEQQARARQIGLGLAAVMRILLLLTISWIAGLTKPLFTVMQHEVTGRDLVMLLGGVFLIAKATIEIHHKIEGAHDDATKRVRGASFSGVLTQIVLIDIVFSLDSVITAVGMARALWVMITAVLLSVAVMMIFAGRVSRFVERHPSVKMLALSFLIMIGVLLVADGLGQHLPRGYVYFAMAFSLLVEVLNIRAGTRRAATHAAG